MVQLKVATVVLILWLMAGACWSVAFYRLRLRFEVLRRAGTGVAGQPLTVDDRAPLVWLLLRGPGGRIPD